MKRTGQVALITGAGRGIGRAIAVALAAQGIRCMLTARTPDGLVATAHAIDATGGDVHTFVADLVDPVAPDAILTETIRHYGSLDILVNNAGVLLIKPFEECTIDDFDRMMAINLRAPFALTHAALPYLKHSTAGAVINIASASGKRFYPQQSIYCASKHGLMGLNKVLAAELRAYGIRVHAICPGGVATEMTSTQRADWHTADLMAPEDIAEAVSFVLALSPRATVDELPLRRIAADPIWG